MELYAADLQKRPPPKSYKGSPDLKDGDRKDPQVGRPKVVAEEGYAELKQIQGDIKNEWLTVHVCAGGRCGTTRGSRIRRPCNNNAGRVKKVAVRLTRARFPTPLTKRVQGCH